MKQQIFALTFLLFCSTTLGQTPINILESTLKINSRSVEELYYGFAKGDEIILNFEELKGKKLSEIKFIEVPATLKFADFKVTKINEKRIVISKTGVYMLRLSNTSHSSRICRVNIQRIPASNMTRDFNTTVYWQTFYDTVYSTVTEKYLISTDTIIFNLVDQIAKVHSKTNLNGNLSCSSFTLPENTYKWSYYIGVNQAGKETFQNATQSIAKTGSSLLYQIPGYGPLAALALGGTSYLVQQQKGEDVDYYLLDEENKKHFDFGQQFYSIKNGKVVNDFSQMNSNLGGTYFFCLQNDNTLTAIEVTIKVTAIVINENWGTRPKEHISIKTRKEPFIKN